MESLLLADSFRVRANPVHGAAEVRNFDRHLARFTDGARAVGLSDATSLTEFLSHARAKIHAYGEGFPRLEVWSTPGGTPRLRAALRPLPPLGSEVELRTAPQVRLEHPERKGPNIARLGALNRELGAEALLVGAAGHLLEGATTSIVWWHDAQLCVVASHHRVASITEAALVELASELGSNIVRERGIRPDELTTHEVWALNALHGIRPVAKIDGVVLPSPRASRLTAYTHAFDRAWQPVLPV